MYKNILPPLLHAAFLSLLLAGPAGAQAADHPAALQRPQSLTLYNGQGVDLNLREVPGAIFSGDFNRERSYFTGVGYERTRGTLGGSLDLFRGTFFENVQHGYEVVALQHRGLQHNAELAGGYFLRTPSLALADLRVNAGWAAGLSHAFGTPSYEDGPEDDPKKRYRTQFYTAFEVEFGLAPLPAWALALRVHHRSGIYGLIAPRHVGSNFIVAGLRYKF
jgi:hypothetical protein